MLPVNDVNELVKKAVALNKQNSYLSFLFMKDFFYALKRSVAVDSQQKTDQCDIYA